MTVYVNVFETLFSSLIYTIITSKQIFVTHLYNHNVKTNRKHATGEIKLPLSEERDETKERNKKSKKEKQDPYIGITENEFKTRYNHHTSSLRLNHKKNSHNFKRICMETKGVKN